MKKIFIKFGLLFIVSFTFAQENSSKKADQLFESYQYVGAIEAYLKLANNKDVESHVFQNLADSYYHIFNTTEAVKWYEKAIQKNPNAETYYRYVMSLKSIGNYAESNKQMDNFAKLFPNDSRVKEYKKNPNYISDLTNKKELFGIEKIAFATDKESDFGAILTNDNTLYFVSTRKASKIDKWSNQPYLDIFKSTRNENGTFAEVETVKELNTIFHDGPVAISEDGNTMFFARDGHSSKLYEKDKKNNVKIGQLGIYKAVKINGKWELKESLPINSISYSVSHPSLSKDGKTLYFSSNMPGGFGETDIWKMDILEDGYGKPENLGTNINSAGREAFPYITEDEVLYFASNGKQGFGGLDIFKIDLKETNEPINLGKPVNTEKDDFSFSFNSKYNVGYFSSNRTGNDIIYQAVPVCSTNVNIVVKDKKTGKLIENASVVILDDKNNSIITKTTDFSGSTNHEIECNTTYLLQVSVFNYEKATASIEKTTKNQIEVIILLEPNQVIITDKEVLLGNVYFEFNKSNITATGAEELNKLVKIMLENPSMKIFVKSHTDTKGSSNYNLILSEQRAQSTVQYLLSRGISKDRISGKGFGSTEPKIACKKCTEEEDAINRRSEFIIEK